MLVKNEADILEPVLRHLRRQVDWVIVSDNDSTDDTPIILQRLQDEARAAWLTVLHDETIGYWQSRKTTALVQLALEMGHSWVIPCDADEVWYCAVDPERRIADYLAGVAPDVQIVKAELYNHIPTIEDPNKGSVLERIGWRQRERGALPKVACRLHPSLVIHAGNHGASYDGTALAVGGLVIRHFSWRDRYQYLRKIRTGQAAYAATDLPEAIGAHWRMFENVADETILKHFDRWFFSQRPQEDDSLIYDPAPVMR